MNARYLCGLIALLVLTAWPALAAELMLRVEGRPAERAVVRAADCADRAAVEVVADSWMGRRAGGVLAVLRGEELKRLSACGIGGARRGDEGASGVFAEIVLHGAPAEKAGTIRRRDDGRLTLRFEGDEQWFMLDASKFVELCGLPRAFFLGDVRGDAEEDARAHVVEMRFHGAGLIEVDRSALRDRFFRDGFAVVAPAKLKRGGESFRARTPRGYVPSVPGGLIVWVSPGPSGEPPPMFNEVADELTLFVAGADGSGNDRAPADRLQLALDVAATMIETHHIDPRRVYVSGLSGGGKIATILQACCPELIGGCVPIVGTGWWREERIGGGQAWPRLFGTPTDEAQRLVRSRRIAPMTGSEDFNHGPVLAFSEQMEVDGVPVRLFDIDGMGHTMPSARDLGEAVRWVDEPWRELRRKEEERARELMREYVKEFGEAGTDDVRGRAVLERIVGEGPWTEEAWRAVEWLGAEGTGH